MAAQTINEAGIALIKRWEGFRPRPYLDPVGIPTIGYGTIVYPDTSKRVTMKDAPISEERATALLRMHLIRVEMDVRRLLEVKLNGNRFSALCSFVYNLGIGNFRKSTLLKVINAAPGSPGIRVEFMKWVNAGGRRMEGLVRRRKEEADLYFTPEQCDTCGFSRV